MQKQAARRLMRRKERTLREKWKTQNEQRLVLEREADKRFAEAKRAHKENWELGPLAPRRDVGKNKETYGALDSQHIQGPRLRRAEAEEILELWGGKFLNIREGDRVVILEGRDKGKIGPVISIDKKRAEVTVEGMNMADVIVPEWMRTAEDPDQRPIRSIPRGISLKHVKLVTPLTDATTGVTRDVIVRKLAHHKIFHDRHAQKSRWQRIIPGLNIVIPWPKPNPDSIKEKEDYPCDTLRREVEEMTFVPTLLTPPMPGSVIDELRNKYSIFRTRHDPEYVAKKVAEDMEIAEKKKMSREMDTPLKEINRKARKLRKAKGKGKLTKGMLLKIGKVISRRRAAAMGQAGLSRVGGGEKTSTPPEPAPAATVTA
ncbi:kow domain-containing domain-containing protein [Rutstroemia sp. NJR-2017a BVV2]|nr:kow domain-containing domain-containing protein [Rutstroemia sp. NJR-2017a BVV2]